MEEKPSRLVKLILGEIALLFVLVVIVVYMGKFMGAESFREVLLMLLPPAVTVIFVIIATLLFLSILQPAFMKALSKFLAPNEAQNTWQFIKYAIWIAALLILAFLLIGDALSIGIFMSLVIMVIILMSYKALINFGGWLHIIFHHRLKIGDLVEIEGIKGKVVGITLMNTRLMEMSEYLGEIRHTNREVMIPNSFVFTTPIFTLSAESFLIWDEIKVLLPAKTNHILAKDIITQVGNSMVAPIMRKHRQEMINRTASPEKVPQKPSTMIFFEPEGILVVMTYFCPISEQSELRSAISESILKEFSREGIDITFKDSGSGKRD